MNSEITFIKAPSLDDLERKLSAYKPDSRYPQDAEILVCAEEALAAAREGNIGVGGCLTKNGQVIKRGHNSQFEPYFRSDLHAEMVLVNELEEELKNSPHPNMDEYALFSSQLPCPMCTLRLISSGIGSIYYAYSDSESPEQGELSSVEILPDIWRTLAEHQIYQQADCSPELMAISNQIFLATAEGALNKIQIR